MTAKKIFKKKCKTCKTNIETPSRNLQYCSTCKKSRRQLYNKKHYKKRKSRAKEQSGWGKCSAGSCDKYLDPKCKDEPYCKTCANQLAKILILKI